jgi:predicted nuclease of predicted toxin-antitoxin system
MHRAKLYADENIETNLVRHLRSQGVAIDYAVELGFNPRDDEFRFQEARRRKAILLTKDIDFLDNNRFPYLNMKDTAIVILRTEMGYTATLEFGYALVALLDYVVASGRKNLAGLKMEIKGSRIVFHALINGKVKHDEIDISKGFKDRMLFEEAKR